ncbi:hypothetical protein ACKWTF_001400 [Chironomus riparius]
MYRNLNILILKMILFKVKVLILILVGVKSEDLSIGSKCQANDGSEGSCVGIDSCNIIRDNLRNDTIQMNQVVVCNKLMRYVCCPAETPFLSSRLNLDRLSSWNLIDDGPRACGKPVIGFGTVFYGTQIKRGAYPWIAALTKTENDRFFCGGTIVSKNIVITAAHCMEGKQRNHVFDPKDIFVILGAHNLEARHEPDRVTASVRAIHVHHDWNPFVVSFDADIAILELANNVNFNEFIQPICIAAPKSEAALKTDGVVVGFGRSENRRIENIARVITSPIHSHQFCANSSDHETLLTHRTFCGGFANGTSVCEGDSGSGLIVKHNGVYYLRGIVSASLYDTLIGCNINSYSIYTDTLEFYSWITTGTDDKVLLQKTLEENRKLKLDINRYVATIQELKEEIRILKAHRTPTTLNSIVSEEYVQPENRQDQFDWKLTKAFLKLQSGNALISPLGSKLLLTLLAEAAGQTYETKTRTELEQVLPNNRNLYDAKEYFKKVLVSIGTLNDAYRVNFASKIYVDRIFKIKQRFSGIAEYNYNANVTNLEFNDAHNSAKIINDWVKDVTRENIKDLVSEDSIQKSILVLINALYFEGTWRFPFNKTISRDFFTAPGRKTAKNFMEQTSNFY